MFEYVTRKVALDEPAETFTLCGTETLDLFEPSRTVAPPAGAGLMSVTVPVTVVVDPAITRSGDTLTLSTPGGETVSVVVLVNPLARVAVIVTILVAVTAAVVTVNVFEDVPAAMEMLEGTVTEASVLERLTVVAPVGAAFNVTVPTAFEPPATVDGATVKPLTSVRVGFQ